MNTSVEGPAPDQEPEPVPVDPAIEERLSGAYRRILRVAVGFSVAGTLIAALFASWQSGLGLALGSSLAYVNFVWLHRGTERIVQRMIASERRSLPDNAQPRKVRFAFPFPLRYALLFGVVYVIVKSYPGLLIGFIVGLIVPILAAMGEGIYEALVISRLDQASR
jgi:ATP synthase I chain